MIYEPNKPYPLWDDNWDELAPARGDEKAISSREIRKKGTTRHIILVRHGQYHEEKDETKRVLTPLGREQADLKESGLKGIDEKFGPCNVKIIRVSGMIRAIETADIIAKYLPGVERSEPDPDLNEGRPSINIPGSASQRVIDATKMEQPRIERAFRKYFHREVYSPANDANLVGNSIDEANSNNKENTLHQQIENLNPPEEDVSNDKKNAQHEFEIIVCHGNVIRYMFCRALQLPPEAW
eukprot:CAMPEP_0116042172 /NCGR_PEP_ID=MMETSP0321-20121206/25524_1 /TAXON_ID=163516 /ORGANISM="Leptocylindrus danicus var. danicus, Strain B650" /LENGTH=239 /DNA_ID=CAMNT_0003522583 /DNA_START=36 /DNA_END=753 /DNA_ORIENTATION=-